MRDHRVAFISTHAFRRLAQRNLSPTDVDYVCAHGRRYHAGKALFIHLGRRDIPAVDRRDDRLRRLEGTVLVLDPTSPPPTATATAASATSSASPNTACHRSESARMTSALAGPQSGHRGSP